MSGYARKGPITNKRRSLIACPCHVSGQGPGGQAGSAWLAASARSRPCQMRTQKHTWKITTHSMLEGRGCHPVILRQLGWLAVPSAVGCEAAVVVSSPTKPPMTHCRNLARAHLWALRTIETRRSRARIHSGIPSQCTRRGLTAQLQPADICLTNVFHAPFACGPSAVRRIREPNWRQRLMGIDARPLKRGWGIQFLHHH